MMMCIGCPPHRTAVTALTSLYWFGVRFSNGEVCETGIVKRAVHISNSVPPPHHIFPLEWHQNSKVQSPQHHHHRPSILHTWPVVSENGLQFIFDVFLCAKFDVDERPKIRKLYIGQLSYYIKLSPLKLANYGVDIPREVTAAIV
jgi:hypothetical protein